MSPFQSLPILCAGGAHIDRLGRSYGQAIMGESNPGRMTWEYGGVARNVAENLARLGCPVTLLSRVGKDENGGSVLENAENAGIDTSLVSLSDECQTGSYTAILGNDGEMIIALADTEIYREITPALIEPQLARLRQFPYWFIDCNLPAATLDLFLTTNGPKDVCVGAVSPVKAQRLIPVLDRVGILFANLAECAMLAGLPPEGDYDPLEIVEKLRDRGCRAGVLTATRENIIVWSPEGLSTLPVMQAQPLDVTGAGDSLAAGTIFGLLRGLSLPAAVQWGLAAASVTVESLHPVSNRMSPAILERRLRVGDGLTS